MKSSIQVVEITQICYSAILGYRKSTGHHELTEWEELEPEKKLEITDWVIELLTGREIGTGIEAGIVRGIISVVRDEKKTLKYA